MHPLLSFLLLLTVTGVIFVNGWTDAPNAIAGVVATKVMPYRKAVWYAALCNLAGLLLMSVLNASVADTVSGMVDFGRDPIQCLTALLAAMAAIVLFAVAAWYFGIPTSESHALIAALGGAALALGDTAINRQAWYKVFAGLLLSLLFGFLLGFIFHKTLGKALRKVSSKALNKSQIFAAGAMAFMHGAQDGQKFVAVLVIADVIAKGSVYSGKIVLREHIPALLLCACVMALGTSVGGKRIIETVASRMVALQKQQAVCADLGSGLCLLIASLTGIPMSTTHTKTAAILGAGLSKSTNFTVIGQMLLAWGITFPVCGALGFLLARAAGNLARILV